MPDYNLGTARGKIEVDASGVGKETEKAEKAVSSFAGGLDKMAMGFVKTVTPIAAGIATASVAMAHSWNGAQRDMAATTGATGKQLDEYMGSVQNVAGRVKGSIAEISSTVADLAVKTKLTGQPLEDLTKKLLALKEIGQQVAVPDVVGAFTKWGVATDQWSGSLDRLFKITQATGTPVATLLQRLAEFSPLLKPLGYDMDQASLIVSRLSDEALPGLRKALLDIAKNHENAGEATLKNKIAQEKYDKAVKDHGATSTEAQVAAGKLKEAQKAVQDSTGTLRESFDKLVGSIKNAKTDQEALALATEAFGSRAALPMMQAIRSGRFEFEALSKAVSENKNTIVGTAEAHRSFLEKLDLLKTRVAAMVSPYANTAATISTIVSGIGPLAAGVQKVVSVGKGFGDTMDKLKSAGDAAKGVGDAATATKTLATGLTAVKAGAAAAPALTAMSAATTAQGVASGVAAAPTFALGAAITSVLWPILLVVAAVALIVGAFLLLTKVFGVDTKDAIVILMAVLLPFIGIPLLIIREWDKIAGFFDRLWDAIWGFFAGFLGKIPGWIADMVGKAAELGGKFVAAVLGFFSRLPGDIGRALMGAVEAVGGFFGNLISKAAEWGRNIIEGLVNGIRNMGGAVADAVKSVITAPLGFVGKFLGIGSPSKLFKMYGEEVVNGLEIGLGKVADIQPLINAVTPPIDRAVAAAAPVSNRTTNAPVTLMLDVDFNFGPGSDAEDLRRAWNEDIKDELAGTLESILTGVATGAGSR